MRTTYLPRYIYIGTSSPLALHPSTFFLPNINNYNDDDNNNNAFISLLHPFSLLSFSFYLAFSFLLGTRFSKKDY
ncbi:hypothetical protein F4775DRAFT_459640 [Biscogniauxia sp. FL1348]|nr:hypothetical protein F4775DRAFT_459640 [Biscogniauxia sp. FL1348]